MEPALTQPQSGRFWFFPSRKIFLFACAAICFVAGIFYFSYMSSTSDFPVNHVFEVASGTTLSDETDALYQAHAIRSEFFFKAFLVAFNGSHGLITGQYTFSKPQNVIEMAWKLSHGIYGFKMVTLFVPEGKNIFQLADIVSKDFPDISASDFLNEATSDDGYLFPDTYYLPENSTAEDIISIMRNNFDVKTRGLAYDLSAFGKPLNEIVIMASIIEKEAVTDEDKKIIAGILWKRLSENIPLQVDAAFAYVPGVKDITNLTSSDLAIKNPYNTYLNPGLPPTPISNPGLDSIEDALHPTDTPYYYYLSDKNGVMHYATTNDEQNDNRAKYLGEY